MSTGWFGIPGKTRPINAKVHVVHLGRTLCGWTPGPEYQFQWYAQGIEHQMIECARCRTIVGKYLAMQAVVNTSGRNYKGTVRTQ